MILSFELLLVLGVIGFYVFDSAMLLYANELVFIETDDHWDFGYPKSNWLLLRKSLYLPNLLSPSAAQYRVFWSSSGGTKNKGEDHALAQFAANLTFLRFMVMLLFVLLLLELPLVLFWFGTGSVLLVLFGFIYLSIITMLIHTYRSKEKLELSGKVFFSLAFEALACPPFAINMVHRITLNRSLKGDPIEFASHAFDEYTFHRLKDAVCAKIDKRLKLEDLEDPRYSNLQAYRDRMKGTGK